MQTEIEVKFPRIDIDEVRARLKKAGAVCEQPMRLMRRVNMEAEHHHTIHAFLRVRDEGDKVTLTYKQRSDHEASQIDGVEEVEVVVSDFDNTVEIFKLSGLPPLTYQETKRETWKLGEVEVAIDQWPWIDPFVEIEGPDEAQVKDAASKLGFDWNDVMICQIDQIYQLQYNFAPSARGLISVSEVKFDLPLPSELQEKADGPKGA